jgi:hypothetical protein
LRRDSGGYPPYESEEVVGTLIGDHLYRLESVPAFAFGLARGDIVEARHYGDPQVPWIERLHSAGGHSTIRVIGLGGRTPSEARSEAEALGGYVQETPLAGLIAIDVPPETDFHEIEVELVRLQNAGILDYNIGVLAAGHKSIALEQS